jgi:WASH complex subunit strumpellin
VTIPIEQLARLTRDTG